jgi:hypothetical protein
MWISAEGGFDTVAVPEPTSYLSTGLLAALEALPRRELRRLSSRASDVGDAIFLSLKALQMRPDDTDEFVGVALPDEYVCHVPGDETLLDGLIAQVQAMPPRWRLDAALILEDAIDQILESA